MSEWTRIVHQSDLPEEGIVVDTKIDDGNSVRKTVPLKRVRSLWWFPDTSMYVYYSPTHWRYRSDNDDVFGKEIASLRARIAELESEIEELKLCTFVTGAERPNAANSYLGDVDVCLRKRPCPDHRPDAWITEINRREACEEALVIAESERLTNEACEEVALTLVQRAIDFLTGAFIAQAISSQSEYERARLAGTVRDIIRAARGAKEKS